MGRKEFAAGIFGDALDFLASITGSVPSWPVAFLIAVAVFYKPIRGLIVRVKSGKVAGVEFKIREELQEAGMPLSTPFGKRPRANTNAPR